jgi:hypothetical protein
MTVNTDKQALIDEFMSRHLSWLQEEAECYALAKLGTPRYIMRMDVEPPPAFHEESEDSYRRGYVHGYSKAMDDLRGGCDASLWKTVAVFFDTALARWRHNRGKDFMHLPPTFAK